LPALTSLRVSVFREWPYLYEGAIDYESDYLETYASCPRALLVIARAGAEVVGAATSLPLEDETPAIQAPFLSAGLTVGDYYYFGESVLLRAWRGRGIGDEFIRRRQDEAVRGGFRHAAFCAVERADDDPRVPVDYVPLHAFWGRRGFVRRPDLATTFSWKEIGETTESSKPMVFWTKQLDA
jgi:GNAT superfamily N-acetyltransferase